MQHGHCMSMNAYIGYTKIMNMFPDGKIIYSNIRALTRPCNYSVHIPLQHLKQTIEGYMADYQVEITPDFQRNHVWTDDMRILFMEYMLRGGKAGMELYWNCPEFGQRCNDEQMNRTLILVDGLQRYTAAQMFLDNKIPVFGHYADEFEDSLRVLGRGFVFYINDLASRKEVMQWYVEMNENRVAHTDEEIQRVKKMIEAS